MSKQSEQVISLLEIGGHIAPGKLEAARNLIKAVSGPEEDDAAALKAEVERLRGALEDVTLFLDEGKESDAYEIVAQALSIAPSDPQPAAAAEKDARIAELTAQLSEVTRERDALKADLDRDRSALKVVHATNGHLEGDLSHWYKRAEKAEADRERLRSAVILARDFAHMHFHEGLKERMNEALAPSDPQPAKEKE